MTIQVQPNETITVSGFVRKKISADSAVTEQTQRASSRIGVCPRGEKSQRVSVRIFNMSAKVLINGAKSDL